MTNHEQMNQPTRQIVEWVHQIMEGNPPALQVEESKLKEAYAVAFYLYRNERYREASYFFRVLVAACPAEGKYWKGLGASSQMLQDYDEALNCYASAQILNGDHPDPLLYVHAADCYFARKEAKQGLKVLESAKSVAEQTKDQRILQHVALMKNIWSCLT